MKARAVLASAVALAGAAAVVVFWRCGDGAEALRAPEARPPGPGAAAVGEPAVSERAPASSTADSAVPIAPAAEREVVPGTLEFLVRVLDGGGRPIAGFPVGIWRTKGGPSLSLASGATAAADGIARLAVAAAELAAAGSRASALAALPFGASVSAELDLAAPDRVVDLRVGDCGALRVVVRDGGAPLARPCSVGLAPADPLKAALGPFIVPSAPVAAGVARFPFLALGAQFRIRADVDGERVPLPGEFLGPEVAGAEAVVEVDLASVSWVAARVLDARGDPVASRALRIVASVEGAAGLQRVLDAERTTDSAGRVRVALDPAPPPSLDGAVRRTIRVADAAAGGGEVEIEAPLLLPAGTTDLGDIRFGAGAIVAAGRVVDAGGGGIAKASVYVESAVPALEIAANAWRAERNLLAAANAEGAFTVFGGDPGRVYRLFAVAPGHLMSARVAVAYGQRDVRIELETAGAIEGSFAPAAGWSSNRRPSIWCTQGGAAEEGPEARAGGAGGRFEAKGNGTFACAPLRPGRWTVRIGMTMDTPLLEFADVDVPAGEPTRDPRLQSIDLAKIARVFAIRVVDEVGAPVASATAVVELASTPGDRWHAQRIGAGRLETLAGLAPLNVYVKCPGYRSAAVLGATDAATVTLRPGIRVRFLLPAGQQVRRGELSLHLSASGPNHVPGGDSQFGASVFGAPFAGDGVATISFPEAGNYVLYGRYQAAEATGGDGDELFRMFVDVTEAMDGSAVGVAVSAATEGG